MSEEALMQHCRQVVRSQIEKNKWRLLDEEELYQVAWRSIQPMASSGEIDEQRIIYQIKGCYAETWYNESKPTAPKSQREQAYVEISRALYGFAFQRWADDHEAAQDIVQSALVYICQNLESCRNPKAFITFIFNAFRRSETTHIRKLPKQEREIAEIDDEINNNEEKRGAADYQSYAPDFESQTLCTNLWEEWYEAFAKLFGNRPRADRQLCAVYYSFWGWMDEEISQFLGIDTKRLHELRFLGKKLVANDASLKNLTQQLLELKCC